jgi:hypothetical protein
MIVAISILTPTDRRAAFLGWGKAVSEGSFSAFAVVPGSKPVHLDHGPSERALKTSSRPLEQQAENEHDREPDPPHGHLGGDGWPGV